MTTTPNPLRFHWHPGIPSRNLFTYGTCGDVPVIVTFLTVLGFVRIEETDGQRLPVRTLSQVDVAGRQLDIEDVETLIRGLGVTP